LGTPGLEDGDFPALLCEGALEPEGITGLLLAEANLGDLVTLGVGVRVLE